MNDRSPVDGTVALRHWGLIRARGAEALPFLQGQLTNDVVGMAPAEVRLAGFCSAKGRLQASFIVWQLAPDDVLLACAASVLPATLKRMSMFVLRAKCRLSDATGEVALHGAVGATAGALARVMPAEVPAWRQHTSGAATVLRLPDVHGTLRCVVAAPVSAGPPGSGPQVSLDAWRVLEVQSGIPLIEAATVDQFVPQMLNYEVIGGVDFRKGCYPGQEVVARSQYRGTIKRRMYLFECDAPAAPGQEVFHSGDPGQPAGRVVNAAPRPEGGSHALVEVKLAALDSGGLHLALPDGAVLHQRPLPYAVPIEATLPD